MSAEQPTIDAVVAVLKAAHPIGAGPEVKVLTTGEVQKLPDPQRPSEYVEVSLSRVFSEPGLLGARHTATSWRVITRFVSRVSERNARRARDKTRTGFEYAELVVDGVRSTPVQHETEDPIEPDDGWFSGYTAWTFTV